MRALMWGKDGARKEGTATPRDREKTEECAGSPFFFFFDAIDPPFFAAVLPESVPCK